jgi:hypothetical protein
LYRSASASKFLKDTGGAASFLSCGEITAQDTCSSNVDRHKIKIRSLIINIYAYSRIPFLIKYCRSHLILLASGVGTADARANIFWASLR